MKDSKTQRNPKDNMDKQEINTKMKQVITNNQRINQLPQNTNQPHSSDIYAEQHGKQDKGTHNLVNKCTITDDQPANNKPIPTHTEKSRT